MSVPGLSLYEPENRGIARVVPLPTYRNDTTSTELDFSTVEN